MSNREAVLLDDATRRNIMRKATFKLSRIILTIAVLFIFGFQASIAETKISEQGSTTIRDHRKPIQKTETVRAKKANIVAPNNRSNTVDHRKKNVRDHRKQQKVPTRSGTNVRDHRVSNPGSQALTAAECDSLGGKVKSFVLCKGTGQFCETRDQFDKPHGVCLTKAAKTEKKSSKSSKPSRSKTRAPAGIIKVAPLTVQECEGLGGTKVTPSLDCKGKFSCATVDKHGVIRVACIDKVAK